MRFQDLTKAVDAVLAHTASSSTDLVDGTITSHGGHPLYLTGADGDERGLGALVPDTPHTVFIPDPRPTAMPTTCTSQLAASATDFGPFAPS